MRPSRLARVLAALPATAMTAGLGTGIATVTLAPDAVAERARDRARRRRHVGAARPPGGAILTSGRRPGARRRRRCRCCSALKAELDPDGRFGPGRFDPWMAL